MSPKEHAAFWCVNVRTIQRWLSSKPPLPVGDVDGMIRWFSTQPSETQRKLSEPFRRRVAELRMQRERDGASVADPDYIEFQRSHAATATTDNDHLADLKRKRAYAMYKLDLSQARNDLPSVNDAARLLKLISNEVHDEELRNQKLRREIGDTLPVSVVVQIMRKIAYWLLRSVDGLLAEICPLIATASAAGPLSAEDVRKLIEPSLLDARLLQPMVRSAQVPSGMSLPRSVVDAMREGLASTIEDGAAEFDRLYATPVPAPTSPVAATPAA